MSRVPAPIRRPSSSRRGWLAHQERAVAPLALRGSEFDPPPGSTWMQFTRRLKTAFTCSSGLAPLRLWGHPRSAWQGRTRGVGEGRLLARDDRAARVAFRSRPQEALF